MIKRVHGVVHGKTLELENELGIADGQRLTQDRRRTPGDVQGRRQRSRTFADSAEHQHFPRMQVSIGGQGSTELGRVARSGGNNRRLG